MGTIKTWSKSYSGRSFHTFREFEKLGASCTRPKCRSERCRRGNALENSTRKTAGFTFPSLAEYANVFGLDSKVLSAMKRNAIILHPGPLNRGVEIESEVADSGRAVILQQVANGIAVRMAILHLCITSEKSSHS